MLHIFTQQDGQLTELHELVDGCWVHLCDPTNEETERVVKFFDIDSDFVTAALDEEESAHLDQDADATLVIVDIPAVQAEAHDSFFYTTLPLGIVSCAKGFITVCTRETSIMEDFMEGRVRTFSTNKRTRFLLQILQRNAMKFLQYLKQIDKASNLVQSELQRSMKNRELLQMMRLEKSLVYFSTSLKGNEVLLEKLLKSQAFTRYADDEDLLEDVIIENKQAIEMCTIYRDILSGTMDAYASIISNNLNIVMKWLASLTIVLTIPQTIFGLMGMNTWIPFGDHPAGFWGAIALSLGLSAVSAFILWRKRMF